MVDESSARSRYFPAIEAKYGVPVAVWFERLAELGDAKYPEQMALLQSTYEMSRTHANALVMTHRGSTHARRHADLPAYLASLTAPQRSQIDTLLDIITTSFPELQQVIAYNQPMFTRDDGSYVVGLSASKAHVSLNPFNPEVVAAYADRFPKRMITSHTVKWALDTPIEADLVVAIVTDAVG